MFESVASSLIVRVIVGAWKWLWSKVPIRETTKKPLAGSGRVSNELQRALGLLLTAYDRALAQGSSPWDFAVEVSDLYSVGLMRADLRWLISMDYVDHAVEITRRGLDGRGFKKIGKAHLTDDSCFVLTDEGVAYARGMLV